MLRLVQQVGKSWLLNTSTILCYLYYNNNKNTITCDILIGSMEVGVFRFVFIFFVCLFVFIPFTRLSA